MINLLVPKIYNDNRFTSSWQSCFILNQPPRWQMDLRDAVSEGHVQGPDKSFISSSSWFGSQHLKVPFLP